MTQGPFKQSLTGADLAIEKGTARVPDDGCYHIIHKGQVVGRHRSLSKAQQHFAEIKKGLHISAVGSQSKASQEELRQRMLQSMSNKQLIWSEDDFARVERKTKGRPKRR